MKLINKLVMRVGFIATCFLTGCATIVSGTSQVVNVQAVNETTHALIPGAKCTLLDGRSVPYLVDTNPGSVLLPRVYGGLSVNCHAKGYYQKQVGAGTSFNAWTLCDVFFWPGVIVDAATGAVEKYPSHITVLMSTHPVKNPSNVVLKK